MSFYNEPSFWAAMTTFFGLLSVSGKLFFDRKDRSNEKQAGLKMSVERFKSENIQKSIDYLNGVILRLEPQVRSQDEAIQKIEESIKMISVIEKGLNVLSGDLISKYDEFNRKLQNVTISFQKTIDRVDQIESKFGKIIKL